MFVTYVVAEATDLPLALLDALLAARAVFFSYTDARSVLALTLSITRKRAPASGRALVTLSGLRLPAI